MPREHAKSLRISYDQAARSREGLPKQQWKLAERSAFLDRVRASGSGRLLEIGAGTGQDSEFFAAHGLAVTAVDLSPTMVEYCRRKGIDAHVMNVDELEFGQDPFDAVYSMNCLLHVPNAELPDVLSGISAVLRRGGLFYLGLYGGNSGEGLWEHDDHDPPRFFSLRSDEQIRNMAASVFTIGDFHVVETETLPFQSLVLRNPS